MKAIVAEGADVNAKKKDQDERTPLHYAAEFGKIAVVKVLLEMGADPLLKNMNDNTPRDLAKDDEIKKLLEDVAYTEQPAADATTEQPIEDRVYNTDLL